MKKIILFILLFANISFMAFGAIPDSSAKTIICLDRKYNFLDKSGYYDTVILGCTHYEFVKNKIIDHFQPQKLISGNHFTAKAVQKFIKTQKSLVNYKRFETLFVGKFAEINHKFCVFGG